MSGALSYLAGALTVGAEAWRVTGALPLDPSQFGFGNVFRTTAITEQIAEPEPAAGSVAFALTMSAPKK